MTASGVSRSDQKTMPKNLSDHATTTLRNILSILRAQGHTEDKIIGRKNKEALDRHHGCLSDSRV